MSTMEANEMLVCENCHHVNTILNVPRKRRAKKDRHLKLDDSVHDMIMIEKIKSGGDIQDALINVFYRVQEYEKRFGKLFISNKKLSSKVEKMTTPILEMEEDELVQPS